MQNKCKCGKLKARREYSCAKCWEGVTPLEKALLNAPRARGDGTLRLGGTRKGVKG